MLTRDHAGPTLCQPNQETAWLPRWADRAAAATCQYHMTWNVCTWNLSIFCIAVLLYHVAEVALAWVYMRREFGWDSLLVTKPYVAAMSFALIEHMCWSWILPDLHKCVWVAVPGLLLLLLGDAIRKAAMITAKVAFTHKIRQHKQDEHMLIRHGIYRYMRHPGYFGWMLWAVGGQLLLVNPLSACLFLAAAIHFFKVRIAYEEELLVEFFGSQYLQYRACTPTYIPGVC